MTGPRVLRADDHVRMRWANGGGTTHEVASSPEGADLASFDWRVSLADVEQGGPFSEFPGVDRILMLVEGAGMELVLDGRVVPLGPLDPLRFDGAAHTSCTLTSGPTKDLNVMTRRGRCAATLDVVVVEGGLPLAPEDATTTLAVVVSGAARADDVPLWPRDVLVVDRQVHVRGRATLGLVRIRSTA